MHLKSITISLALFTFRRKRFLPDHSAQSPTALFLSPAANNIQPLENCQGISGGGMTPQLYLESEVYKVNRNGDSTVLCGDSVVHIITHTEHCSVTHTAVCLSGR